MCALCPPGRTQCFLVHNYTEEEGLPVSETFDVAQGPDGRIWCATRAGLVIYDGLTWEFVRDVEGALIRGVQSLEFDSGGRAWIFRRNGSVLAGTLEAMAQLEGNTALAGRNTMLLDSALLERPEGVALVVADFDRRLYLWAGQGWEELRGIEELVGILRVVEAAGESFYVGGDEGLIELASDGKHRRRIQLPAEVESGIRGLLYERSEDAGRLWIQGQEWIGWLHGDGVELLAPSVPDPIELDVRPLVQAADGSGGLFYGNEIALFHFERGSGEVQRLGRANGLVAEGVRGLCLDDEGLLWAATPLGLSKLVGRHWATYGTAEGLLEGETSALAELPDGGIVLGHNRGLSLYSEGRFEALPIDHDLPQGPGRARILDLDVGPDGTLWIAGSEPGLGRRAATGKPTWTRVPEDELNWATAVLCDREGRVWVGASSGLFRLEGGQLRRVGADSLRGVYVRCIAESGDGQLLVGGETGVWLRSDGRWRLAGSERAGEGHGVYALLVGTDGRTWVGTRDGLWLLEEDHLRRAPVSLPADRAVYSLVEDRQGRLWIGTDFGVYRTDGERLEHFTVRNGLSGNETNRAAALVDRRGHVWLGTEKGLSVFRPELEPPASPPSVELLGVQVGQVRHPTGTPLRLKSESRELIFKLRARTLRDELSLTWRTWLEGLDEGWSEREGRAVLEVHYPGLPPGRYRFRAQARRSGGEWGPEVTPYSVHIVAPTWAQPWFHAAWISIVAALGALLYRLFAQRRTTQQLELEVNRRSEELAASQRELAQTERLRSLGILAGGIAHDFNNVLTALMGGLSLLRLRLAGEREHEPLLDSCDQALQRAQQLSTQLLTFAKGGEPVTRTLAVAQLVEDSTRLVLSGSSVSCELDLPADLWPIRADPAQIYQAFENLLLNARQAMPTGGMVHVRARNLELPADEPDLRAGRYVRLEVRDKGHGIPDELLARVFEPFFTTKRGGSGLGLATAHSVVKRHGGRLTVSSPRGGGATFTLDLPAAEEPRAPVPEPEAPTEAARRPGHVLVMDDEPVVRSLLAEILRALGREVTVSASGEEALRELVAARERGLRFSCAILDLTVPGAMGGREALARLREIDPSLRAIATSGYTEDAVLARPEEAGFQGALAKPFRVADVAELLHAVERRKV